LLNKSAKEKYSDREYTMQVEIPWGDGSIKGERWVIGIIDYLALQVSNFYQMSFADIPDAMFFEDLAPDNKSTLLAAFGIAILTQSIAMKFSQEKITIGQEALSEFADQFDLLFRIESLRRQGRVMSAAINNSTKTLGELIGYIHDIYPEDPSLSGFSIEAFDKVNDFMIELPEGIASA
jgi:hypothetical protein